jgi:hypothetical protein
MLRESNMPKDIREKASEYFEYCWRKNVIFDKEMHDFSDLSQTL